MEVTGVVLLINVKGWSCLLVHWFISSLVNTYLQKKKSDFRLLTQDFRLKLIRQHGQAKVNGLYRHIKMWRIVFTGGLFVVSRVADMVVMFG
jgi:hypothetical protein